MCQLEVKFIHWIIFKTFLVDAISVPHISLGHYHLAWNRWILTAGIYTFMPEQFYGSQNISPLTHMAAWECPEITCVNGLKWRLSWVGTQILVFPSLGRLTPKPVFYTVSQVSQDIKLYLSNVESVLKHTIIGWLPHSLPVFPELAI